MEVFRPVEDGRGRILASVALAVLLGLCVMPADAAEPKFEFDIGLGRVWTNSAGYTQSFEDSDTVGALRILIPYTRRRPTYTMDLLYRATLQNYKDFNDLDNIEHLFRWDRSTASSETVTWTTGASYFRTQSQALPEEVDPETGFLSYRTSRDFSVSKRVRPTWFVGGGMGARTTAIEEIDDFDSGAPPQQFGDQVRVSANVTARHDLSEIMSVSFGYSYTGYSLDLSQDETTHRLYADVDRAISPKVNVTFGGGVAYRIFEIDNEITYEARARVARNFERGTLSARVTRTARNGDAIPGASIVSTIRVGYTENQFRYWKWTVSGRYSLREPSSPAASDLEYLRGTLGITFRGPRFTTGKLQESFGFKFHGSVVDQKGATEPDLNSSYYIVGAAVIAYLGV
jgi:hypothetical protein